MLARDIRIDELPAAFALLRANGWTHRLESLEQFGTLVQNSQRTAAVVEGGQVIGFARGITDGQSNGYLSMVVVAVERRRCGVGRALVNHIIAGPDSVSWVLQAGRAGASGFFRNLGFEVAPKAMQRARRT